VLLSPRFGNNATTEEVVVTQHGTVVHGTTQDAALKQKHVTVTGLQLPPEMAVGYGTSLVPMGGGIQLVEPKPTKKAQRVSVSMGTFSSSGNQELQRAENAKKREAAMALRQQKVIDEAAKKLNKVKEDAAKQVAKDREAEAKAAVNAKKAEAKLLSKTTYDYCKCFGSVGGVSSC